MCGRFTLTTPVPDLAELFGATPASLGERTPRFNIAPTEEVVVLRSADGSRTLAGLRWGLIPRWTDDPTTLPLMINARSESIEIRRAFRDLILDHRCAVLADGFYEWRTEHGMRQPYYVRRRDGKPMALAGLWDVWHGPEGPVSSCTIVTTSANELLLPLHHRMPVVLEEADAQLWLDAEIGERTVDPLQPLTSEALEVFPVGTRVNRVVVDDPTCIAPIDQPLHELEQWKTRPSEGETPADQLGLF